MLAKQAVSSATSTVPIPSSSAASPQNVWKAVGSPARRASIVKEEDFVFPPTSKPLDDSDRPFRTRAASTPGLALGDSPVMLPPGLSDETPTSGIWTSSASSATLLPSFTTTDNPTDRHFRSYSLALGLAYSGSQETDNVANLKQRMADMTIPESPMVSELTEEEYLNNLSLAKGRSRSKSSSAIYGLSDNDDPFFVPESQLDKNQPKPRVSFQPEERRLSRGVPDMSTIWKESQGDFLHRRSSTQPSGMAGTLSVPTTNTYRRYSVAPSMVNRFLNVPGMERPIGGLPSGGYDAGRRRHSVAVSSLDRKINTRFLAEGLEKLGMNDPNEQLEEIDDYFENTENRTRAWMEAGRNLQMNSNNSNNQTGEANPNALPISPLSPLTPGSRQYKFPLFVVEFKAGRTDYFYLTEEAEKMTIQVGDLAIVEADRGKDLGKVIETSINSVEELLMYQATHGDSLVDSHNAVGKEIQPKRLFRLATPQDVALLFPKGQDEAKAMGVCQVKIRQKKLPMEIVDAEYQWDRRKLTFYFVAERRIDFRELVRELFKIYKTRIWMCAVHPMKNNQA